MSKVISDSRNDKNQDGIGSPTTVPIVHYVPFKVEYDGKGNVTNKFSAKSVEVPEDSTTDGKVFENQFRGKSLMGKSLHLPEDYEGLVCSDLGKTSSLAFPDSQETTTLNLETGFDSLTYWNWDKPPSGMDTPVQLLDWLELSKVLHEPIEEESQ